MAEATIRAFPSDSDMFPVAVRSGITMGDCGLSFKTRCARRFKGGRITALKIIFSPKRSLDGSTCRIARANGDGAKTASMAESAIIAYNVPAAFNTNIACICSGQLAMNTSMVFRG